MCQNSWTAKFLSEVDSDCNWNTSSSSAVWDGIVRESGFGTESVGTSGTGTAEVHVDSTGMLGGSGDSERIAIKVSKHFWLCHCYSASFFWRSQISFRKPRISGWLSGNGAKKLWWGSLTGETCCKGLHATLSICRDGLTMGCRDTVGICSGESGTTTVRLAYSGLYSQTTVACKFESSKF